jgi:hypothetical protein
VLSCSTESKYRKHKEEEGYVSGDYAGRLLQKEAMRKCGGTGSGIEYWKRMAKNRLTGETQLRYDMCGGK